MSNPTSASSVRGTDQEDSSTGQVEESSSGPLQTSKGTTTIADGVVQKIASLATREVSGVHDLGGGTARTMGVIRDRIPGASQATGQGVSVEVGETQAAIDLEIVTEYGDSIAEVAKAVRRHVIEAVEGMTSLEVTEVNVSVNDIHLPSDDSDDSDDDQQESRVQ